MTQGYFAALVHSLLRETRDGRVVTYRRVLPFFRRRWYYIAEDERQAFERRVLGAQLATMVVVVLGVQVVTEPLSLRFAAFLALLALVVQPGLQVWVTARLTVAEIDEAALVPVTRSERDLRYARALGARTLWTLLVAGVLLASLQAAVALTDGAWWAWLGLTMFAATTVYFARLLTHFYDNADSSRAT